MSRARLALVRERLGVGHPRVREVSAEVYPFAVQTQFRAYQYMDFADGSRLRVIVQPGGEVQLHVIHGRKGRPPRVKPPRP